VHDIGAHHRSRRECRGEIAQHVARRAAHVQNRRRCDVESRPELRDRIPARSHVDRVSMSRGVFVQGGQIICPAIRVAGS
jgi:hypothetical protein